ncbi:MAG TPA: ABC transporter permease [Firmicutes bacterium]|nr:ABC transporter permease [Bacillota bacterium]
MLNEQAQKQSPGESPLSSEYESQFEYSPLSQGRLVARRFARHKLGVAALVILGFVYLLVLFAPFFAPNDSMKHRPEYSLAPPTRIRFRDEDGNFGLRPFIYASKRSRDPVTLEVTFVEDRSAKHPLYLFVRGSKYKVLGIESDIHFFGPDKDSKAIFFPFGADRFGRDLLGRILLGGRVSLSAGLFGVILSLIIGVCIGAVSGYYGGLIDSLIQRFIELLRSFPRIPLWLALSMVLPPQWSSVKVYFGIVTLLSLIGWTSVARVVRGQILALREKDFVQSARALGGNDRRVIFRHILPNITSYLIVSSTLALPGMILSESTISFLGLGIKEPMTSWGLLLKDAQSLEVLALQPWLLTPGIFIIISVLAFNFLGDAVRDAFDPFSNK